MRWFFLMCRSLSCAVYFSCAGPSHVLFLSHVLVPLMCCFRSCDVSLHVVHVLVPSNMLVPFMCWFISCAGPLMMVAGAATLILSNIIYISYKIDGVLQKYEGPSFPWQNGGNLSGKFLCLFLICTFRSSCEKP